MIFNAFWKTPFPMVRVVILGQDPYHGPRQAHGLSFSVQKGIHPPPSLQNIFRELNADLGIQAPNHGDLTSWAEQGVLLLNSVLTVRHRSANSHRNKGWEQFTNNVIRQLNDKRQNIVFLLWGRQAGEKSQMIDGRKHLILKSSHPSPYSADRGFFGSRPFSKINKYLQFHNQKPINWNIPN
jgi:uracil-DNA glycosylase